MKSLLLLLSLLIGCATTQYYYQDLVQIKFTGDNVFYSQVCTDIGIVTGEYNKYLYLVSVDCGDQVLTLLVPVSDISKLQED